MLFVDDETLHLVDRMLISRHIRLVGATVVDDAMLCKSYHF